MDEADVTAERQQHLDAMAIRAASNKAQTMSIGVAGCCDKCGDDSPRLMGAEFFKANHRVAIAEDIIEGICPRCRDKLRLP